MYEHYHLSSHGPEAPALRNTNTKIVKARRAWYFFLTSDIKGRKGGERITRGRGVPSGSKKAKELDILLHISYIEGTHLGQVFYIL